MSMEVSFTHSPPVNKKGEDVHEDAPGFFWIGLLVEVSVKVAKLYRGDETWKTSIYNYGDTLKKLSNLANTV